MSTNSLTITEQPSGSVPVDVTVRGTLIGLAAAFVATTIAFLIGSIGEPVRVVTGWNPDGAELTYAEVVITAGTAVALGGVLLWWMGHRSRHGFLRWQRIAIAVAVLSAVPLL